MFEDSVSQRVLCLECSIIEAIIFIESKKKTAQKQTHSHSQSPKLEYSKHFTTLKSLPAEVGVLKRNQCLGSLKDFEDGS